MAHDMYSLTWSVDTGGYEVVQSSGKAYVVPARRKLHPNRVDRQYRPLDHSGLFRTFARLEQAAHAVIGFANQFGALTNDRLVEIPGEVRVRHGQPLDVWCGQVNKMSVALALWEAICSGAIRRWRERFEIVQRSPWGIVEITYRVSNVAFGSRPITLQDEVAAVSTGDLAHWGKLVLEHEVTRELDVQTELLLEQDQLRLLSVPKDLKSALWLQFAEAINGNKRYNQCVQCHNWFEVAPGVGRSDKRYCSDACRSAAYRERKTRSKK